MAMRSPYHAFHRPFRFTVLALILAAAAGCGSGNTYPVRGKVVFKDGTPLTGGQVVFRPVNEKLPVSARGDVQEDGSFTLGTYKEGDGAVAAKYQAAINPPLPPKLGDKRPHKPILHPRFESYETSGLEFEVTRGPNDFTIVVDKP